MRSAVALIVCAAVLALVDFSIAGKERLLAAGKPVYLELAPVDPRSLMQGDYMALNYEMTNAFRQDPARKDGHLVVALDERGVARFARFHEGTPLAPGEYLLRYRVRDRVRLGAESYFFQEGHADRYAGARYGELRVARTGDSVLVGLADDHLRPLGAR